MRSVQKSHFYDDYWENRKQYLCHLRFLIHNLSLATNTKLIVWLQGIISWWLSKKDRTQWGLYTRPTSRFSHTDQLSSVNKMFIIRLNVTSLLTFCFANGTELLKPAGSCSSSLLFFVIRLFGTSVSYWKENKRKRWKVFYIIDTEISSRKKDYIKMIRKMH